MMLTICDEELSMRRMLSRIGNNLGRAGCARRRFADYRARFLGGRPLEELATLTVISSKAAAVCSQ
ncbi:hypothetical protein ACQZ42_32345 [Rhizobium rhizogenes]